MDFKNYYEILNISDDASTNEVKYSAKKLVEKIKNSKIDNKRKMLKDIAEAYQVLYDYHTRKKYDEKYFYYKNNSSRIKNYQNDLVVTPLFNFFNNDPFEKLDKFKLFDFPHLENNVNNKMNNSYYHSSFTTSHYDKDGNIVTEKKSFTKSNDKEDSFHTITTIDKDGKKTIKKIPIKNRYFLKNNQK